MEKIINCYEKIEKIDRKLKDILVNDLTKNIRLAYDFDDEKTETIILFKNNNVATITYDENTGFKYNIYDAFNALPLLYQRKILNIMLDVEDEMFKVIKDIKMGTNVFDDRVEIILPMEPKTKKITHFVMPSEAFSDYQDRVGYLLKDLEIDKKVNVKCLYYMSTKRKVDLNNLHSSIHDVLVHYRLLKDDNSDIIVDTDRSKVLYDKDNPRTEISITLV